MGSYWILVLITVYTGGRTGGVSQEEISYKFTSEESCETSGEAAVNNKRSLLTASSYRYGYTCFPVGQ